MSNSDSRSHSGSTRSRSDHDSRPHRHHKDKYRRETERGPGGSRSDSDGYDRQPRNRSRSPFAPKDSSPRSSIDDKAGQHDTNDFPPPPPPPPRITKISIGFSKPAAGPIKMSLGAGSGGGSANMAACSKPSVASVFNTDSDEDDEEMPAEARMRMRNIGRETPTSAGPNSFGKTKHGFCDAKKVFEKNMKQAMDSSGPKAQKPTAKFPQTVYKLSNNNS